MHWDKNFARKSDGNFISDVDFGNYFCFDDAIIECDGMRMGMGMGEDSIRWLQFLACYGCFPTNFPTGQNKK